MAKTFSKQTINGVEYLVCDEQGRMDTTDLRGELNKLQGGLNNANILEEITGFVNNYYIPLANPTVDVTNPTSSSDWKYVVLECMSGDKFLVTSNGGNTPRAWGFVDSEGNVLNAGAAYASYSNYKLIAPTKTKYLVINYRTADKYIPSYKINAATRFDALTIRQSSLTDQNVNESGIDDLNELKTNTIMFFAGVTGAKVAHLPISPFSGYVTTVNYLCDESQDEDFSVQIAHTCRNNQNIVFFRSKYSSWTTWAKTNSESVQLNAYRGLKNFTVLGDSISVSLSYPTISQGYPVKSWATIMADSMNANADIYAQGGMTTGAMLVKSDYPQAVANANENQFAIIALGINDCNESVSAETFYQNYLQLITDMLENHKFVFCCTIPAGLQNDNRATYNTTIKGLVSAIGKAFLIDVDQYSSEISPLCHLGHMSSTGYAALASYIQKGIDDTVSTNSYFLTGTIDQ